MVIFVYSGIRGTGPEEGDSLTVHFLVLSCWPRAKPICERTQRKPM